MKLGLRRRATDRHTDDRQEKATAAGSDEPPLLAGAPASPWQDGLGRTSVRCGQSLLVLTLASLVIWAGLQLRVLVIPVLIATIVAAALSPLVGWLHRHHVPRTLATALVLVGGLSLVGVLMWLVVRGVAGQWPELSDSASQGVSQLQSFVTDGPLPISEDQIAQTRDGILNFLSGRQFRSTALAGISLAGQVATGLVLGVVVLFFLLKDGAQIWRFLIGAAGPVHQERLEAVGQQGAKVLGGYVRGTAAVAVTDSTLIALGVWALGVPLVLPIALLTFLAAFVPVIGAVVAGALAALVALVTNGPATALLVVGVVILVNQLDGNVLQPLLLGQTLSLHPLAILLALTAGTILGGIVGTLLAVPVAAVAWTAATTWNERRAAG